MTTTKQQQQETITPIDNNKVLSEKQLNTIIKKVDSVFSNEIIKVKREKTILNNKEITHTEKTTHIFSDTLEKNNLTNDFSFAEGIISNMKHTHKDTIMFQFRQKVKNKINKLL